MWTLGWDTTVSGVLEGMERGDRVLTGDLWKPEVKK